MNPYFNNIRKNFGFGFMRLPMIGDDVDIPQTIQMVDTFLNNGFNYFDTAHGYINGKSELALKECLTSRYPRDQYILTNKLSGHCFEKEEDILPLFQTQLDACGVEYFDFYLMHAQNRNNFQTFKANHAYEISLKLREEGKIRHLGISFHDKAEILDQILTEYPQIEVVQIQFNYVDYEDEKVESRKCYEVCRKHGKPVIVMEPVKGGSLVNLPAAAQNIIDRMNGGMMMVLSGMSNMEQMIDNVSFMKSFTPLNEAEQEAVAKVCAIFRNQGLIACTACRYCTEVCPQGIAIPDLFAALNAKRQESPIPPVAGPSPSECIKCGKCEEICPQTLKIRELLVVASEEL